MNLRIIPEQNESYNDYINRILSTRPNEKDPDDYQEHHHIIPKCMGGTDDRENMIWLYAQEHYYAHKLLALENTENKKLSLAWLMMCQGNNKNTVRTIDFGPEEYEEARKLVSKNMIGENNPMFHKEVSLETRRKISKALSKLPKDFYKRIAQKRSGELHYLYGKHLSQEVKDKISASKQNISEETRKKLSESHKGIIPSKETLLKRSIALSGSKNPKSKKVICLETNIIFETLNEAGKYSGTTGSNISKQIKGERKSAGKDLITGEKLHWEYVTNDDIQT